MGYWRHSYTFPLGIRYVESDMTAAELTKNKKETENMDIKVICSTWVPEERDEPVSHLKVVK